MPSIQILQKLGPLSKTYYIYSIYCVNSEENVHRYILQCACAWNNQSLFKIHVHLYPFPSHSVITSCRQPTSGDVNLHANQCREIKLGRGTSPIHFLARLSECYNCNQLVMGVNYDHLHMSKQIAHQVLLHIKCHKYNSKCHVLVVYQ